jgi:hypothetical protein
MRTSPEDISLTREDVDMASSRSKTGSDLGSSWTAKLTLPRRLPKRVPVTFRPREGVTEMWEEMVSHLQLAGRLIMAAGKEMRLRKERRSEVIFFGVLERWLKETGDDDELCFGISSLLEMSSFW